MDTVQLTGFTREVPSALSMTVFVLVVFLVADLWLYAVVTASAPGEAPGQRLMLRRLGLAIAVLAVWLGLPAVLAANGFLAQWDAFPPPALPLIGGLTVATIVLAFSPLGTRIAGGIGLTALVGFQAFRIPVEWFLHRLYTEGIVPVQMTWAGLNFDVVSGLTAAALGLWLWSGRFNRKIVLAWNCLGLVLLLTIVAIAVMSLPGPLRKFPDDPANLLPGIFPYVWLPTFLVQAALFGHIIVFRKLAGGDRRNP